MIDSVEFDYIDSNEALAEACRIWSQADFLAIDTEFIRQDTFYPIAGLLQVGAAGRCALIDPLAIDVWAPLIAVLLDEAIAKVIHSCSEDLEVFQRLLGCVPKPLLDTQIGAAMAGWGVGLSYQNLVLTGLGIHVDKGETRSNWLQRPLTRSQCEYAALDVLYLQRVYRLLSEQLEKRGRLEWWQEDCRLLIAQAENPPPVEDYFLRIKGLWKLRPAQRLALKVLCEWREYEARARDIPRGRVLKDAVCFEIVRRQPEDVAALSRVKTMPPAAVRRYGEQIIELLEVARAAPALACPAVQNPLNGRQNSLLKRLRAQLDVLAAAMDAPAEILARKRDLEAIVRGDALPPGLLGWRKALVTDSLQEFLGQVDPGEGEYEDEAGDGGQ